MAYIVRQFPVLSQTFVTNEVAALRRQGTGVRVVALESGAACSSPDRPDLVVERDLTDEQERVAAARWWKTKHPLRYQRFRKVRAVLADELGRGPGKVDAGAIPLLARRVADEAACDALHAHFGWQAATAAWMTAALTGLPWSMTLHANDIFSRRRNLEAKIAAADEVVTVCRYNERFLRSELGIERSLHRVVCGIEPADVRTEPDGGPDVVAVGRLVAKKGFDVLIDALPLLLADRPSINVEIVGDGPLRDSLRARAEQLGVGSAVTFRGALSHDETLALIASAKVFCLPCRVAPDGDRDSMPLVVKEAMVRGVPVVSTNEVAVPEMVDEATGRLVDPDDAPALAGALSELLDDPGLRQRLGAAAHDVAVDRFLLDTEVAKLASIFETMARAR